MRIFAVLAALFGAQSVDAKQRPSRSDILRQAIACGLTAENLVFTVDGDGVDNVEVYPVGDADDRFYASAECLGEWAIKTGAAVGLHFKPRAK